MGPEGKGPKLSPTLQRRAATSQAPDHTSSASGGGRWQAPLQGPWAPTWAPRVPPTSPPHFPLLLPSPQRAGGGPVVPSPTPSPKAQAPWQRPRRQGGVCQRHLSLTSSITGHHGNTHDSTQEGLPVQPSPPSVLPSLPPSGLS